MTVIKEILLMFIVSIIITCILIAIIALIPVERPYDYAIVNGEKIEIAEWYGCYRGDFVRFVSTDDVTYAVPRKEIILIKY